MDRTLLSIDCGTQSTRALIFDLKGNLLAKEQIFYKPYHSPKPGYAEQDASIYWQSLQHATLSLKQKYPKLFSLIAGISVTTLRDTMVPVDKKGKPLYPAIVWLDQRKADKFFYPNPILKLIFKIIGIDRTIDKLQIQGKSNWLRQRHSDIWQKTYKYLQISGFINYKLTGCFTDSIASQIGHIPFDYRKLTWANPKNPFVLSAQIFPIEQEKLPNLVKPGEIIGYITEKASEQTGLPIGLPVIAGGSDKGCETLGMGVIDINMANLSFGTTATIQTTVNKFMEPIPFFPSYPAVVPGYWNPEIEIYRGFWMISWFKEEFAYKEVMEAEKTGIKPEEVLNQLLDKAPAGSLGLIVQPYWTPGLGEDDAKGAIIGFGDVHGKAHVYRSVIEGLVYGLRDGMHQLEKRGKFKFKNLAVSGGASQSKKICQITADVFNKPIVRGYTHETSGLGAAIITAVGLGFYDDISQAVKEMVKFKDVFEPNVYNSQIYNELFNKVYKKMYKRLEPLYKKIRKITGYPEY